MVHLVYPFLYDLLLRFIDKVNLSEKKSHVRLLTKSVSIPPI